MVLATPGLVHRFQRREDPNHMCTTRSADTLSAGRAFYENNLNGFVLLKESSKGAGCRGVGPTGKSQQYEKTRKRFAYILLRSKTVTKQGTLENTERRFGETKPADLKGAR